MSALCDRCGMNEPAPNDEWCPSCVLEVELILAEEEDSLPFRALGQNGSYTMEDVARRVAEYEDEYGLPSDALLEMHLKDQVREEVPHLRSFDRSVWLSLYRELLKERHVQGAS